MKLLKLFSTQFIISSFHFITWKLNILTNYNLDYFYVSIHFILLILGYFKKLDIGISIVSIPLVLLYLITVISFIDRSLTVNMLLAYDIDNFILKNDLLNIDKLNSNYIIEKRLQEQSQAGIINMNGDKISLEFKGKIIHRLYTLFANFYQS